MAFEITSGLLAVGAGADWTVQPAAGVQVIITEFGRKGGTQPSVGITNGTLDFAARVSTDPVRALKIFINNTNYLWMHNTDGAEQKLGYCGVFL